MRSLRLGILLTIGLAMVLASAPAGAGEDAARRPAPQPPEPREWILIPQGDLDRVIAREPSGLLLELEDFLELLRQADERALEQPAPTVAPPPVPLGVERADVDIEVTGRQARVRTVYVVRGLSREEAPEPLVLLLPTEGAALAKVTWDGQPGHVVALRGRHGLAITPDDRNHELVLEMAVPIAALEDGDEASGSFSVPLRSVASGTFAMTLPGTAEVEVTGGTLAQVAHSGEATSEPTTKVRGALRSARQLTFLFRSETPEMDQPPYVVASGTTVATFDPTVLRLSAALEVSVFRSAVDRLTLALPAGFTAADVRTPDLRRWVQDGEQIHLIFSRHLRGQTTIAVEAERMAGPGNYELSALTVTASALGTTRHPGAQRGGGRIGLARRGRLGLRVVAHEGLDRIDLANVGNPSPRPAGNNRRAPSQDGSRLLRAWRQRGDSFRLVVEAAELKPKVDRDVRALVTVEEREVRIVASFAYRIREGQVFSAASRIPAGWRVESTRAFFSGRATTPAHEVRVETDPDSNEIIAILECEEALAEGTVATVVVEAAIEYPDGVAALGSIEIPQLVMAKGEAQGNGTSWDGETSGYLGIAASPAFRLRGVDASGLTPIPAGELSRVGIEDTGLVAAWRLDTFPYSGTVRIERKAARLGSRVVAWHTLADRVLHSEVIIDFTIEGAPVEEVSIVVPEGLGERLRVDGPGIREKTVTGQVPGGLERWRVRFQGERTGALRLEVSFDTQLEAGLEDADVKVPVVRGDGVDRQSGWIAVRSSDATELTVEATGLVEADTSELPSLSTASGDASSRPLFVWRFLRPGWSLTLHVRRHTEGSLLTALVATQAARTAVDRDGVVHHDVTFHVRHTARQFLTLWLPTGSDLWAVMVDGEGVRPARGGDGTLIVPLASENGGSSRAAGEANVRVVYAEKQPPLSHAGRLQLTAPELRLEGGPSGSVPVLEHRWTVHTPEDLRILATGGNSQGPTLSVDQPLVLTLLRRYGRGVILCVLLGLGLVVLWQLARGLLWLGASVVTRLPRPRPTLATGGVLIVGTLVLAALWIPLGVQALRSGSVSQELGADPSSPPTASYQDQISASKKAKNEDFYRSSQNRSSLGGRETDSLEPSRRRMPAAPTTVDMPEPQPLMPSEEGGRADADKAAATDFARDGRDERKQEESPPPGKDAGEAAGQRFDVGYLGGLGLGRSKLRSISIQDLPARGAPLTFVRRDAGASLELVYWNEAGLQLTGALLAIAGLALGLALRSRQPLAYGSAVMGLGVVLTVLARILPLVLVPLVNALLLGILLAAAIIGSGALLGWLRNWTLNACARTRGAQRVAALAVVTVVLSLTTATAQADENVPVHDPRPGFKVYVTYEPDTLPDHEPGAPLPLPRQSGKVFVPEGVFERLFHLAHPEPEPDRPEPRTLRHQPAIAGAWYDGTVSRQRLELRARLHLVIPAPPRRPASRQSPQPPPLALPLGLKGAAIRGMQLTSLDTDNGGGSALRASLETGPDGSYLLLIPTPRKDMQLQLDLDIVVAPRSETGASVDFAFDAPSALAQSLRVTAPGQAGMTVHVPGALGGSRTLVGDDGVPVVEASLGLVDQVRLEMRPDEDGVMAAAANAESRLKTRTLSVYSVGISDCRLAQEVTFQVSGGRRDSVAFAVPAGLEVTTVASALLRSWRVVDDPGAATRRLEVILSREVQAGDSFELTLTAEARRDPGSADAYTLPALEPLGTVHATGILALATAPQLTLAVAERSGLSQVNPTGLQRIAQSLDATADRHLDRAYAWARSPWQLSLRLADEEADLRAEVRALLSIARGHAWLRLQVDWRSLRRPVFDLEVGLDSAWQLLDAQTSGLRERSESVENGQRTITLSLERGLRGNTTSTLLLRRNVADDAANLALPGLVLAGVRRQQGTLAIAAEPSVDLSTQDLNAIEVADPTTLAGWARRPLVPGGRGTAIPSLAFTWSQADWGGTLLLKHLKPLVNASVVLHTRVAAEAWHHAAHIYFGIERAGARSFSFTIPARLARTVEVVGDHLREVRQEPAPDAGGEARVRIHVELQGEVRGRYDLAVSASEVPPDPATLPLPRIAVANVERERHFVLVEKAAGLDADLRLAISEGAEQVQPEDVLDASSDLDASRIAFALRATAPEWGAVLRSLPLDRDLGPLALVDFAELETVVERDGLARTRVRLRLRNRAYQFLEVAMPSQARLFSAHVGGEPRKVYSSQTQAGQAPSILIPLPKKGRADLPFDVELIYQEQLTPPSLLTPFDLEAPQVRNAEVSETTWTLWLPEELEFFGFGGNVDETHLAMWQTDVLRKEVEELERLDELTRTGGEHERQLATSNFQQQLARVQEQASVAEVFQTEYAAELAKGKIGKSGLKVVTRDAFSNAGLNLQLAQRAQALDEKARQQAQQRAPQSGEFHDRLGTTTLPTSGAANAPDGEGLPQMVQTVEKAPKLALAEQELAQKTQQWKGLEDTEAYGFESKPQSGLSNLQAAHELNEGNERDRERQRANAVGGPVITRRGAELRHRGQQARPDNDRSFDGFADATQAAEGQAETPSGARTEAPADQPGQAGGRWFADSDDGLARTGRSSSRRLGEDLGDKRAGMLSLAVDLPRSGTAYHFRKLHGGAQVSFRGVSQGALTALHHGLELVVVLVLLGLAGGLLAGTASLWRTTLVWTAVLVLTGLSLTSTVGLIIAVVTAVAGVVMRRSARA